MALIVISFDGINDTEFENMAANPARYPNIAAFMQAANYVGNTYTTFVSNTYPIHTSIATGKHPAGHGIISNILGHTDCGTEIWALESKLITAPTIFDAAAKKGLSIGTIAWPVACGNKSIKWNLPEVHLLPGQSRLREHIRHGSILFQLRAMLRHRKKMQGLAQPYLDNFFTAVMVDLLREKKPDLAMVHLIAYDGICHQHGISNQQEMDIARAAMDANLGKILAAAPNDSTVIIFSDHGHLPVDNNIDLAPIFGDMLIEQCGGCAFFTKKIEIIEEYPWFGRLLTDDEMAASGYAASAAFGIAAAPGYSLARGSYRSNHGYPRDYDNYRVFHAVKNAKQAPHNLPFDDIRNVTAIINQELGLNMPITH